jgi:predicted CopG family antitoxin
MNTKLTLTIKQEIIEKAKQYAKSKNRSLSDIIENYLKLLTKKETKSTSNLDPSIDSLKGAFKMPENFDYQKELQDRIEKKYL